MNIIENYTHVVFKNYVNFEGRAKRSEYWLFFLANFIISFALGFVEGMLGLFPMTQESVLANIYALIVLLPGIAVAVRRIHDTDHSGWFILVPFYNLYLLIIKGTEGDNRFGADQLQSAEMKAASSVPQQPDVPSMQ